MRVLVFVVLVSLSFSCKEKEEKIPDYVMSEERFVEVLTEFQIAEALVRLGHHRTSDSLILNDSIYAAVLRKMNTTTTEFDSNFNYYSAHPEQFEAIYEKVITNLSARSAELIQEEKKKKAAKKKAAKKKKAKKAKNKKKKN